MVEGVADGGSRREGRGVEGEGGGRYIYTIRYDRIRYDTIGYLNVDKQTPYISNPPLSVLSSPPLPLPLLNNNSLLYDLSP